MGLFKRNKQSPVGVTAITLDTPGIIAGVGYHRLCDAPEVSSAVGIIADLISDMPIHLMENQKDGDVRIRDQLARKIDINPWSLGTRQTFMQWIISTMLTEGEAFVIPFISGNLIRDLIPAPGARTYRPYGATGYFVDYKDQRLDADNVLHFRLRPDPDYPWMGQAPTVQLQSVVDSLLQTMDTKKAYMASEYKPPVVIAVNSDSDMANENKRKKFIDSYLKRTNKSEPLIIPADLMTISQVKPLTLTDLCIKDGLELDKKTVASLLDIPPFFLGVGSFNRDEYNTWIGRRIMTICRGIEQELTKKLLYSESRYWRFNARSLYSYSLQELSNIAMTYRNGGLMSGNEARNWVDLPPKDGLNDLVMLENFVPVARLGDQKKLNPDKEELENV